MPSNDDWFKFGQYAVTFVSGGLAGALFNYFMAERKGRKQPVGMKTTISYVDLPAILKGSGGKIALPGTDDSNPVRFSNIAVIRIELLNSGNKDIEEFKLGIDLPDNTEAIGFESEGEDRYHIAANDKVVSTDSRQSKLDIVMTPFHKKDRYVITILAYTESKSLKKDDIKPSRSIPIKFVDTDAKETLNLAGLLNNIIFFASVPVLLFVVWNTFFGNKTLGNLGSSQAQDSATIARDSLTNILRKQTMENWNEIEERLRRDSVKRAKKLADTSINNK